MNKLQFNSLIIGLSLSIGLLPSCGGGKPSGNSSQASRYFAADESLSPIIDEEYEVFTARNQRDSIFPLYISEQEAMQKLMDREVFLVFTTRALTPDEENYLISEHYRPRVTPLAYDALALIVNKANTDTLITADNFRRIMAGEITSWKELNPASNLGDIKVAFDNPKSATLRFVVDSVMEGRLVKTDGNVQAAMTSAEVVDYVENHENAIGVVGSIWLNDQRDTTNVTYGRNITVMRVSASAEADRSNSYYPSQWNIAYGYYPFIRTIYVICIDPFSSGVPKAFANFCWLPNPGQLIFFNAGLFPARAEYSVRDVVIQ